MKIETLKTSKHHLSILLATVLFLLILLYLKTFFTVGIRYEDDFYQRYELETDHIAYFRVANKEDYIIQSKLWKDNLKQISLTIPSYETKQYLVDSKYTIGRTSEVILIYDAEGTKLFEGIYNKNTKKIESYEGNLTDELIALDKKEPAIYNKKKVNMADLILIYQEDNLTTRGHMDAFLMAFIVFVITLLDIKYPTLFLPLQNRLRLFPINDSEDAYTSLKIVSQILCITLTILLFMLAVT